MGRSATHTLYAHSTTFHVFTLHSLHFHSDHLHTPSRRRHSVAFFTFHDIRNTCTFECILRTFSHKHIRHTLHALTTHLHTHSLWAEHIPVHSHRPPHTAHSAPPIFHYIRKLPTFSHIRAHAVTFCGRTFDYIRRRACMYRNASSCIVMYRNVLECSRSRLRGCPSPPPLPPLPPPPLRSPREAARARRPPCSSSGGARLASWS